MANGKMRALVLAEYAGPAALCVADVEVPRRERDELLLQVWAIGINYPDLLLVKGKYQHRPDPPIVPGCEVAGVVVEASAESRFRVGDRVAAFIWDGGFAEYARVPARQAVHIPESVSFSDAAAGLVNNHTAYFALARRARTEPGESVLVLGAAGGVGTAAVQVAAGIGARVIAGVSRPERAPVARAAGAQEVVVLEHGFAAEIRQLTDGRGVDVVVDPVGGWVAGEALRSLAPEGRLMVVGFAAGEIPEVAFNRLLLRNISVMGVAFGAFIDLEPTLMQTQAVDLDEMTRRGVVRPHIGGQFTFEEIPTALARLDAGAVSGKAIAFVRGDE
ncbi:zinc-binding dehydrogenase [Nocardia sp. R7R-8]|uniref:zinc-binding dehydrogenase n=1 Tax=Nocardia sp. R7R-8 TaxID=3459304 RepID=UPI00403DD3B9